MTSCRHCTKAVKISATCIISCTTRLTTPGRLTRISVRSTLLHNSSFSRLGTVRDKWGPYPMPPAPPTPPPGPTKEMLEQIALQRAENEKTRQGNQTGAKVCPYFCSFKTSKKRLAWYLFGGNANHRLFVRVVGGGCRWLRTARA